MLSEGVHVVGLHVQDAQDVFPKDKGHSHLTANVFGLTRLWTVARVTVHVVHECRLAVTRDPGYQPFRVI